MNGSSRDHNIEGSFARIAVLFVRNFPSLHSRFQRCPELSSLSHFNCTGPRCIAYSIGALARGVPTNAFAFGQEVLSSLVYAG